MVYIATRDFILSTTKNKKKGFADKYQEWI